MLQSRIGRLPVKARRALRAASVFGHRCWDGGVAALLGTEQGEARRWLDYLVDRELLNQIPSSRLEHQREYHFRQGLMRDAAYSLLPEEDCRVAHGLAGKFLQGLQPCPAGV